MMLVRVWGAVGGCSAPANGWLQCWLLAAVKPVVRIVLPGLRLAGSPAVSLAGSHASTGKSVHLARAHQPMAYTLLLCFLTALLGWVACRCR